MYLYMVFFLGGWGGGAECVERKDAACCGNPPPPPPSLLYLFFYSSFLPLFLACSPTFHQGRSSPGAEIQFRSSSSAFSAFTSSNGERILSYLLPTQIERPGAGSSPCFHAVLSGCYSSVLRPAIGVYGGPGAAQYAGDH